MVLDAYERRNITALPEMANPGREYNYRGEAYIDPDFAFALAGVGIWVLAVNLA
jgi:hypothetical protein